LLKRRLFDSARLFGRWYVLTVDGTVQEKWVRQTTEQGLARAIPPDIAQALLTEVRRRIAQVEAGEVTLIPGEEALAHVRRILVSAHAAS